MDFIVLFFILYFWVIIRYYFIAQTVLILAIGSSFIGLVCFSDIAPLMCVCYCALFIYFLALSYFLALEDT